MELNDDFKSIITEYGRLPEANSSVRDFMDLMNKRDVLLKIDQDKVITDGTVKFNRE